MQHKVIAYLNVMVEITLESDEDTDKVLDGVVEDINRGLGPDTRAKVEVADVKIYSDEQVRG